jgi:hypothetical protein
LHLLRLIAHGFLLLLRRGLIDRNLAVRAVLVDDPNDPLGVVNVGDQVNDDAASVADGPRQVIDVVERRNVALALAGKDGLRPLVSLLRAPSDAS